MNEQSLERANAFLAVVASRARPGEVLDATPAEIGREAGLGEPLAAARAVRALLARRRLEVVDGRYRLIDAHPVEPGEPEAVPRPKRQRKSKPKRAAPGKPAYSDVGRAAVERLLDLGREIGTLRASARAAKEEARTARLAREDAERRANELSVKVRDLEAKLDMAEQNLRTLLAAAKGTGREGGSPGSTEMEAILGILKGDAEGDAPVEP